ncbi:hypothetical protein [Nitrosococcus watsonii]|uniref:2,3-bisphosphoglycerate-independent phosphoglycerate mutase n=1 Tax=Nitrosococcus watsoni (strain C-113) TaxID=105559 RepID=D8K710_NITWC|nr:hypothetical protein [Nitrosococcus watsonii]ADJ28687.1 2,3-bisphosphoglycerate-independent phosphoglycerate mutase [Nitrosococcus watsonii C-113]
MLFRTPPLHLTLLVPGLAQALAASVIEGEGARLPFLERIIGQADVEALTTPLYETLLFALFGISQSGTMDVPVAPLMYSWDKGGGSPEPGWWLRADPVCLHPDRDRLVLFGPSHLQLSKTESQSLAKRVAPLFTEYGWQFEAPEPDRWYLRLPQQPEQVTFTALAAIEGKYIEPGLPSGPNSSRWRTLLNEIQMLLHDCPTNLEREQQGLPVVNSVWFWGAGEAPLCPISPPWRQIGWGQDPLLQALAAYCEIPSRPVPEGAKAWLVQNSTIPGNYLVGLDSFLAVPDFFHCPEALEALEENWLSILYAALRDRELASLTFYPMNGCCYHLTWLQSWRLWRRPRSLIKSAGG